MEPVVRMSLDAVQVATPVIGELGPASVPAQCATTGSLYSYYILAAAIL